jgi:hypothetical protein
MKTHFPLWISLLAVACLSLTGCSPSRTAQQGPPSSSTPAAPPDRTEAKPGAPPGEPKAAVSVFQVVGTVAEVSRPPKPGTVPYKDAIIAVHLTSVQSKPPSVPKDVLVYLWGMKANQPVPASRIEKGQTLSLTLQTWDSVEDQYGGYNRVELSDPNALSLEPYWGEMK